MVIFIYLFCRGRSGVAILCGDFKRGYDFFGAMKITKVRSLVKQAPHVVFFLCSKAVYST